MGRDGYRPAIKRILVAAFLLSIGPRLFASVDWPNEPWGATVIADYAFSDVLPTGQSVPVAGGWYINNGGAATRVTDDASPLSSPYVLQVEYPMGFTGGDL